ncbi:hypothetical protein HHI36_018855 [Cryptolaemus montrouzieri]|uniref:Uncharacterized protein n=1 Tax=Cryptolaemus montrouzieri TaxID=559131 RepID=A0ABD2P1I7_9CUCU
MQFLLLSNIFIISLIIFALNPLLRSISHNLRLSKAFSKSMNARYIFFFILLDFSIIEICQSSGICSSCHTLLYIFKSSSSPYCPIFLIISVIILS